MSAPIEQTLRPETVNELLLIERINELHRLNYMNRGYVFGARDADDPNSGSMTMAAFAPTLRLAGVYHADIAAPHGRLRIEARTHGPTSFGLAQYVDERELRSMEAHDEARLFDQLWRTGMRSLAAELKRITGKDRVL